MLDKSANARLVSWRQVEMLADALAKQILAKKKKYQGIVIVANGGLIPSYLIARKLGIKNFLLFSVTHYGDKRNQLPKAILRTAPIQGELPNSEDWLIVDDVSETGESIQLVKKFCPKSSVAVLYKKTDFPVEFFGKIERSWVKFPWELT